MALNVCVFMGNLGDDPKLTFLPSGVAVANFSIACGRKWKDKQTNEIKEETDWVRCVAFNKRAEIISEHFKKGSQIHVTTQMRNRSWESDGQKHYITEFFVQDFQFCGNRQSSGDGVARQQAEAYGQTSAPKQTSTEPPQRDNFEGYDDNLDIPF